MSKKKTAQKSGRSANGNGAALMQQFGIDLTIPNFDDPEMNLDMGDSDLESELYQLQGAGSATKRKSKVSEQKKKGPPKQDFASFQKDVDKLLKDFDAPIKDEDLSDVDESELLAELQELGGDDEPSQLKNQTNKISSIPVVQNSLILQLEERRKMYAQAVEKAKKASENNKARRHERQLKLIEEYIQSARAGQITNGEKCMAEVNAAAPPLSVVSNIDSIASSQTSNEDNPTTETEETTHGQEFQVKTNQLKRTSEQQSSSSSTTTGEAQIVSQSSSTAKISNSENLTSNLASQIDRSIDIQPMRVPIPATVQEALQQRLDELKRIHNVAAEKGESSRVRRLDRQIQHYQAAIVANRKNQPFDYSELPDLPGFGPIPGVKKAPPPAELAALLQDNATAVEDILPESLSFSSTQQSVQVLEAPSKNELQKPASSPSMKATRPGKGPLLNPVSVTSFPQNSGQIYNQGESVDDIRKRCEQALTLAQEYNRRGNKTAAAHHLREYKALKSQLPLMEVSIIPQPSPKIARPISGGYEIISNETVIRDLTSTNPQQLISRLQEELLRQSQRCARNEQLFRSMPGVNNAKYAAEHKALGIRSLQDLEKLKQIMQQKNRVPIFHYEKRQLTYPVVNDDLTDDLAEVNVIRALNLNVPSGYTASSLDTYVVIEFPETINPTQTSQTRRATGADIVEYPSSAHTFKIKRLDRSFLRAINRKEVKFSIYYKAGFLKSDRLLGVASAPLLNLLKTATIHDSFHIYTDTHKKKAEGKLEVKIRIREACGPEKQTEVSDENWLFIDGVGESAVSNIKSPSVIGEATDSTLSILPALLSPANILNNLLIAHTQNDLNSARSSPILAHEPVLPPTSATNTPVIDNLPSSLKLLASKKKNIDTIMNKFGDRLGDERKAQLIEEKKTIEKEEKDIMDDLIERGEVAADEYLKNLDILLKHYGQELIMSEQEDDKKRSQILREKIQILTEEIHLLSPKHDVPTSSETEVVENPDIF